MMTNGNNVLTFGGIWFLSKEQCYKPKKKKIVLTLTTNSLDKGFGEALYCESNWGGI